MSGELPSLDSFRRCEVPGCIWRVLEPHTRCTDHGGEGGPEYAESDEGDILSARHFDVLEVAE